MNTKQQVIVLSGELKGESYVKNRIYSNLLESRLKDLQIVYNKALGSYKSEKETSFVCLPKNEEEINLLKHIAFNLFNQESVLYQDANGKAYLIYSDDTSVTLGKLRQVPMSQTENLEAFTILNDKAYAVV